MIYHSKTGWWEALLLKQWSKFFTYNVPSDLRPDLAGPVGVLGLLPLPLPLPLPRLPVLLTELLSDTKEFTQADVLAEVKIEDKAAECISGE